VEWIDAIHLVDRKLEERWTPPADPGHSFFDYSPLPLREFKDGIDTARNNTNGNRYLEVGCGIGTKLALMHHLGWEVTGIDIYQPYLDVARELCPEAKLICADMRDIQFFDADVVFMYRPGFTQEMEWALELWLADNIALGTILFLVPETEAFWRLGLEHIGPHLWIR
jgi:SAM-dependent methyltransferase